MNSTEFRAAMAHVAGDPEVDASIDEACGYIDLANDKIPKSIKNSAEYDGVKIGMGSILVKNYQLKGLNDEK